MILDIHRGYLDAGSDIIETNSFNGTAGDLRDFGSLTWPARSIIRRRSSLGRPPTKPRRQANPASLQGRWGPTTKAMTVTGGITFEDLKRDYHDQALALVEGGADLLLLETCQDTRNVKAGLLGIRQRVRSVGPIRRR